MNRAMCCLLLLSLSTIGCGPEVKTGEPKMADPTAGPKGMKLAGEGPVLKTSGNSEAAPNRKDH